MWVLGQWRPDKKKNRIIAPPTLPLPVGQNRQCCLALWKHTHYEASHMISKLFLWLWQLNAWLLVRTGNSEEILPVFSLSLSFLSISDFDELSHVSETALVDCRVCLWLIAWINKHSSFSVWQFWSYVNLRILTSHLSWTQMTACRLVLLVWAPGTCWEINCLCFGFI